MSLPVVLRLNKIILETSLISCHTHSAEIKTSDVCFNLTILSMSFLLKFVSKKVKTQQTSLPVTQHISVGGKSVEMICESVNV